MKARVIYDGSLFSPLQEFSDDLEVGTQVDWNMGSTGRTVVTRVIRITEGDFGPEVTHEVELSLLNTQTRMVCTTVPANNQLLASDFMQMIMLVNERIISGNISKELMGLHHRLSDLVPYVLRSGNPSAIEIIKDL